MMRNPTLFYLVSAFAMVVVLIEYYRDDPSDKMAIMFAMIAVQCQIIAEFIDIRNNK